MYLKPKAGLAVPDPALHDYLPAVGREVEDNQYWQRRLMDGDVELAASPKEAPASKSPA